MAEFIITAPDGKKYKVNGATKEGALAALKKRLAAAPSADGHAAMTAKAEAALRRPEPSMLDANLLALAQGGMFNFGDEMFGGVEAARAGLSGQSMGPAYTKARDFARGEMASDAARFPKSTMASGIAGNLMTGIPAAIATGGTSLPAVVGIGAAQGGLSGYGAAEGNDLRALGQTAAGAALGGAGAMAGYGLGKLIEKFTTRGLAAGTIMKAVDGNTDELMSEMRRLGMSAAETDEVLRGVVREQAAKNSSAAIKAVPGAQGRLSQANQQAIDDINRLISPENATKLMADLQRQGQAVGSAGYEGGAYLNPATVGLMPEMTFNPAMSDALAAAKKLAMAQGREFDVTNLGIQDLDAIQRALSTSSKRMFESTPENTLLGPVYDDLATGINKMAVNMAPELGETQAKYAGIKGAQEAVELGKKALNPTKEFVEVAEEFAALPPLAQDAYRAGLRTRLVTMLQSKQPTANAAAALKPEAIIEKMKAVGFPEAEIDAILRRSGAARGVLDALQGGSDTARKLAAAKASESPLTAVKPQDLMTGALVHPLTVGALPVLRSLGGAQERRVAEQLIKALVDQNPNVMRGLLRYAPQKFTAPLGLMSGAGATASQTGLRR